MIPLQWEVSQVRSTNGLRNTFHFDAEYKQTQSGFCNNRPLIKSQHNLSKYINYLFYGD